MTKQSISLDVDPSIMEKNMRIVQESPMEEEINKLMSSVDPFPSKLVKPSPGFCVKTYTKDGKKKVFVNICVTDAIPAPPDITNERLIEILNSDDPSSYRVPMSLGEGRTEPDKSGTPATVYDVAINNQFFKKVETDELFRTFFLTVVFEGLQDKYQFEADLSKYVVLKNRKTVGTLQSHRIQVRDVRACSAPRPLIEEVAPARAAAGRAGGAGRGAGLVWRLRREPPTGEIDHLLAEFKIPPHVEARELALQVGEDRLVLGARAAGAAAGAGAGAAGAGADVFLPASVDQLLVQAHLDRNTNVLSVKMPVIH